MGISKLIYNGVTQMDITSDSVSTGSMLSGYTAHAADGEQITGTYSPVSPGSDFIVKMSRVNGDWVPDKTFAEIKAAFYSEINIIVTTSTPNELISFTNNFSVSGNSETFYIYAYEHQIETVSSVSYASTVITTYAYTTSGYSNIESHTEYDTSNGTAREEDVGFGRTFWSDEGREVGTGNQSAEDDVVFYDYDGTIIISYSKETFANLTALPANPSHTGLTAQGWNWTLSDAKTHVAKYGFLDIGQSYVTTSGATEIDIELTSDGLSPYLCIAVNGSIEVNWGDGGSAETITGTSSSTLIYTNHTYSAPGKYTISIYGDGATFLGTSSTISSDRIPSVLRASTSTSVKSRLYSSTITAVRLGTYANLGVSAFRSCGSLRTISIPTSVTSFGDYAFYECGLKCIVLPSGVTEIGTTFIGNDYALKVASLPNGLTSIPSLMFYNCPIKRISLTDSITSIGSQSFYGCMFETIRIPDGVTSTGGTTFSQNHLLKNVVMGNNLTTFTSTSTFSSCENLESVILSDALTNLGGYAFNSCYSLQKITVPEGVSKISSQEFYYCYSLNEIHIKAVLPPTLASNSFTGIPSTAKIYVPSESVDVYKVASNWSTYASQIYGE